jgi:hypothetical protein
VSFESFHGLWHHKFQFYEAHGLIEGNWHRKTNMSLVDESSWPTPSEVANFGAQRVVINVDMALELFQNAGIVRTAAEFSRGPMKSIENSFTSAGYVKEPQQRYSRKKQNKFSFIYDPVAARDCRKSATTEGRKRRTDDAPATPPTPPQKLRTERDRQPPDIPPPFSLEQPTAIPVIQEQEFLLCPYLTPGELDFNVELCVQGFEIETCDSLFLFHDSDAVCLFI